MKQTNTRVNRGTFNIHLPCTQMLSGAPGDLDREARYDIFVIEYAGLYSHEPSPNKFQAIYDNHWSYMDTFSIPDEWMEDQTLSDKKLVLKVLDAITQLESWPYNEKHTALIKKDAKRYMKQIKKEHNDGR